MFPPPTHSRVNPAVFPVSLGKRTKLSLQSTRPWRPQPPRPAIAELTQPSYTLCYFLKYARFPPTLLSTSPSAWGLSPYPHTRLCCFPYLINLYLASTCYFSSSREAVPALTTTAKPSSLPS